MLIALFAFSNRTSASSATRNFPSLPLTRPQPISPISPMPSPIRRANPSSPGNSLERTTTSSPASMHHTSQTLAARWVAVVSFLSVHAPVFALPIRAFAFLSSTTGYLYDARTGAATMHLVIFASDLQGPVAEALAGESVHHLLVPRIFLSHIRWAKSLQRRSHHQVPRR